MAITRINEFEAAENQSENLFAFLQTLLPYISSSEGCISCELLRDTQFPSKFVVLERWESIDAHKNSIALFPKEKIEASMPLFGAPPKGTYYY